MRVDEDEVQRFLTWARNYHEIVSFEKVAQRGRKWLIALPPRAPITASGMVPGWSESSVVPDEVVLTSREALAFGYGLAIAGARPETRDSFAAREWGWERGA